MAARPGDRMGRRRSRVFWPTLFVLPALVLLIGLGIWQLHRLDEKAALLARIDAGLAAAPVTLPATIGDPVAWDYRRVEVAGVFLHDRELIAIGTDQQPLQQRIVGFGFERRVDLRDRVANHLKVLLHACARLRRQAREHCVELRLDRAVRYTVGRAQLILAAEGCLPGEKLDARRNRRYRRVWVAAPA